MPARTAYFETSGDILADRRFLYAQALREEGDNAAAADLLVDILALVPDWTTAWFALGEARLAADDREGAIEAFNRAATLDPEDRHGAKLRLARIGALPLDGAMSAGYVRAVFDQYANDFDKALVKDLAYRGPELLAAALGAHVTTARHGQGFRAGLDLGCGTGLAGKALAPMVTTLDGVDLSQRMIAWARMSGAYRELTTGDMLAAVEAKPPGALDLIVAADAFVYLADLTPIAMACARALEPGGVLAFTVETHPQPGITLGAGLRFQHGRAHVETAMDAAGLALVTLAEVSTRQEAGLPVPCLLVIAARN
jgi:predicted TPR repeat methyltransferase